MIAVDVGVLVYVIFVLLFPIKLTVITISVLAFIIYFVLTLVNISHHQGSGDSPCVLAIFIKRRALF